MAIGNKIDTGLNWLCSRARNRSGVLLYHRVAAADDRDPFRLCVAPGNFERQMASLAESGGALALDEFVDRWRRGCLERGSVVVTFDDGYIDVLDTALPILERYGIPATLFVTTGDLGEPFWWDRLAAMVYGAPRLPERPEIWFGEGRSLPVAGLSREQVYEQLHAMLGGLGKATREEAFAALGAALGVGAAAGLPRSASPDELRRAARHPLLTLGAHTETHSRLTDLDYAGQLREIGASAERVAEISGSAVKAFSYPFGLRGRDYDANTIRAARAAGIDWAFAANRNAVTERTSPFEIPRIWIHDRPEDSFRRRLRFWVGAPAAMRIAH